MNPIDRKDASRRLGAPASWDEESDGLCGVLAIADIAYESGARAMESLWRPEPEELAALAAGHPVILTIVGVAHPVVSLSVAATPMEDVCDAQSAGEGQ